MFLKKSEGGLGNGKCPETFEGTKREEKKRGQKVKKRNSERQMKRQMEVPGRDSKKRGSGGGGVRN